MRKLLILLLVPFLLGAAPTRTSTYVSGETISSSAVTGNEDAIFTYLQGGIDTIKDGTIVNDDISASANIQSSKLNLLSVTQDVLLNNDGNDTVLEIDNNGTGYGLYLHQDGVLAAGKSGLYINTDTNNHAGHLVNIRMNSAGSNVYALYVYTNSATQESAYFQNDGNGGGIELDNNGTGCGLRVDSSNNGVHMILTGAVTAVSPVAGSLWFDGTNLKFKVGTVVYNLDMTPE